VPPSRAQISAAVAILACSAVTLAAPQAASAASIVAARSAVTAGPHSVAGRRGYVVRPGDSLAGIAGRFGISPVALAAANGIVDGRLYAGARLLVDVSAAGQPPRPATAYMAQAVHVVTPGETLGSIARANALTVATLAAANGLRPGSRLARGTGLVLPGRWRCPVAGHTTFVNDWGFPRAGNT
jgi:LysM repeat protein